MRLAEQRKTITDGEYTLEATLRVGPYKFSTGPLKLSDSWVNSNASLGAVDTNVSRWLDDLARKAMGTGVKGKPTET